MAFKEGSSAPSQEFSPTEQMDVQSVEKNSFKEQSKVFEELLNGFDETQEEDVEEAKDRIEGFEEILIDISVTKASIEDDIQKLEMKLERAVGSNITKINAEIAEKKIDLAKENVKEKEAHYKSEALEYRIVGGNSERALERTEKRIPPFYEEGDQVAISGIHFEVHGYLKNTKNYLLVNQSRVGEPGYTSEKRDRFWVDSHSAGPELSFEDRAALQLASDTKAVLLKLETDKEAWRVAELSIGNREREGADALRYREMDRKEEAKTSEQKKKEKNRRELQKARIFSSEETENIQKFIQEEREKEERLKRRAERKARFAEIHVVEEAQVKEAEHQIEDLYVDAAGETKTPEHIKRDNVGILDGDVVQEQLRQRAAELEGEKEGIEPLEDLVESGDILERGESETPEPRKAVFASKEEERAIQEFIAEQDKKNLLEREEREAAREARGGEVASKRVGKERKVGESNAVLIEGEEAEQLQKDLAAGIEAANAEKSEEPKKKSFWQRMIS